MTCEAATTSPEPIRVDNSSRRKMIDETLHSRQPQSSKSPLQCCTHRIEARILVCETMHSTHQYCLLFAARTSKEDSLARCNHYSSVLTQLRTQFRRFVGISARCRTVNRKRAQGWPLCWCLMVPPQLRIAHLPLLVRAMTVAPATPILVPHREGNIIPLLASP